MISLLDLMLWLLLLPLPHHFIISTLYLRNHSNAWIYFDTLSADWQPKSVLTAWMDTINVDDATRVAHAMFRCTSTYLMWMRHASCDILSWSMLCESVFVLRFLHHFSLLFFILYDTRGFDCVHKFVSCFLAWLRISTMCVYLSHFFRFRFFFDWIEFRFRFCVRHAQISAAGRQRERNNGKS